MRRVLAFSLILLLAGCAANPPVPPLAPGAGLLQQLQYELQVLVTGTIQALMADTQATIDTVNAQLKAGVITQAAASQRLQCPTNIQNLVAGIQQQIGVPIPQGAGIVWLLDMTNSMNNSQISALTTQIKLIQGTCAAMAKIPGLPF